MGMTDQWNRAGWDPLPLTGGGGGGGNVEEEWGGCGTLQCLPPLRRQWWICHRSSRLLHSPTVTDARGWELPAMSVIFYFRSFHPVRLQWLAMQGLSSHSRDMYGWLVKKSMSDEHSCEHFKPRLRPIYWLAILDSFCSREIAAVECGRILLNGVKPAMNRASPRLKSC